MPLVFNRKFQTDQVALWKIADDEFQDQVVAVQGGPLEQLHTVRRKQKQACLRLVTMLAGTGKEVFYDDHGKPHLADDMRQLSFTHSGDYAAVMLSDHAAGIDFELIRPKVLRIAHKFLRHEELNDIRPIHAMEHAHVYWGAKESLYKVYGKQQLLFKENLHIEPFNYAASGGYLYGTIITGEGSKRYCLYYEKMAEFMLVHLINR